MTALAPVRIYAVQDRRRRGVARPWVVRWAVAGREHSRSYPTRAAADAARSALTSALGAGERFDPETGQPASRDAVATTVAVAAAAYVRAEWPSWTPHARRSAVEGLARAVIAAVDQRAPAPPEGARAFMVRTLLAPSPVPATGPVAAWVERWSLPLGALKGDAARRVWDALGVGEAGQSLAPSTAARYRKALRGCLADAVDAGRLASIPAPFSGERKRKASGGGPRLPHRPGGAPLSCRGRPGPRRRAVQSAPLVDGTGGAGHHLLRRGAALRGRGAAHGRPGPTGAGVGVHHDPGWLLPRRRPVGGRRL